MCEICSKLSIKTPERCQRRSLNFWLWTDFINYSGVSTVNFDDDDDDDDDDDEDDDDDGDELFLWYGWPTKGI